MPVCSPEETGLPARLRDRGPARPGGRLGGKGPPLRDGREAGEPTTVMGGSAPPGRALPQETCPLLEEFSSAAENLFWTKCYLHR